MDNLGFEDNHDHETFNMFWHGGTLSPLETSCIKSFIKYGHTVRVFTYREVELPDGVIVEDANQILPANELFIFENSPSGFSNIFRYKLLLEHGGWWVDTDVVCLSSDIPPCDYFWAEQMPGEINGAVLKFPVGDPRLVRLLEQSIKRSKYLQIWGQLGPHLLTEVLHGDKPPNHLGSTEMVYPIRNTEVHYLWLPEFYNMVENRCSKSIFLHLWHAMFSRIGIDLSSPPPKGSYLSGLHERYGVTVPGQLEDEITTRRSIIHYLINIGKVKTLIPELMDIPGECDSRITGHNLSIQSLVTVVSDQHQKITDLEDELSHIKPDWIHKLTHQLRSTKNKMFPPGSRGAYFLGKFIKMFKPD